MSDHKLYFLRLLEQKIKQNIPKATSNFDCNLSGSFSFRIPLILFYLLNISLHYSNWISQLYSIILNLKHVK